VLGLVPVSLITTLKNEQLSVRRFLESHLNQSRRPDEIVIVDGGSTDGTVEIINEFIKEGAPVRLFIAPGNRSLGRNIAIKEARYDLIACTDAGSLADRDWLKNIILPLEADSTIDVVSGFTRPLTKTLFEDCVAVINLPEVKDIDPDIFLPSSRSVAFRKKAWQAVGGYPEWLSWNEDTLFNILLKKAGFKFVFAPEAVVYWSPPSTIRQLFRQFYFYARGDGQAALYFWEYYLPKKYLLYGLGMLLLMASYFSPVAWILLFTGLLAYLTKPCSRALNRLKTLKVFLILPVIVFVRDLAEMVGYLIGALDHMRDPKHFKSRAN